MWDESVPHVCDVALGSGTGAPERHHVRPGFILKWGVLNYPQ